MSDAMPTPNDPTSAAMAYGVGLAHLVDGDWRQLPQLSAAIEALGYDQLWFTDHIVWFEPGPDPLTAMAVAAAATSTIRVGTGVLQLPLRSVAEVAKSAAFVDHLSGGRVTIGVGVGEHLVEYEAAGVADRFPIRGRLLDEGIEHLRSLWSTDATMSMAPRSEPPIWIGGRSAVALRRAARVGDGWLPHLCPVDWYGAQVARLHAEVEAAGRAPGSCVPAVAVLVHVDEAETDGDPLAWAARLWRMPPKVFTPIVVRGSAEHVAARLADYRAVGAEHLVVTVASDHPLDHLAALRPHLAR